MRQRRQKYLRGDQHGVGGEKSNSVPTVSKERLIVTKDFGSVMGLWRMSAGRNPHDEHPITHKEYVQGLVAFSPRAAVRKSTWVFS